MQALFSDLLDSLDWDPLIWGLGVLALILGFLLLSQWRRSTLERLGARGPLPGLIAMRGRGYYVLQALVIVTAALFLVLALMRPKYGMKTTEVRNVGIDIAVVMDASKSMTVPDVVPERLGAARQQVFDLLKSLPGGRVSLVPFAGAAFIQTQLTSDFEVVKTYLSELRVADMPGRGTAIGLGIEEAIRSLVPADALAEPGDTEVASDAAKSKAGSKFKAIVLFTDGGRYENPDTQRHYDEAARKAAKNAAKHHITVYTVGVGTGQGRPVPLLDAKGQQNGYIKKADGSPLFSQLHAGLLEELAQLTGGDTFHLGPQGMGLGNKGQLELVDAIAQLGQREFDAAYPDLQEDRFQWPLFPAVLLLIFEAWLAARPRRPRAQLEEARS
jgi:Ca-activated chloride channel family protein